MTPQPDLSVTIVSWNTRELLAASLASLAQGARQTSLEVCVVDNASGDGSVEMVRERFPAVRLIENRANLGFARAVNQSWAQARGRYWLLLNSDARCCPGALDTLVDFMESHPRAGLASARLEGFDGAPQHCAQPVPGVARTLLEASRLHKLLPASIRARTLLGPYFGYDRDQRLGWTWGTALVCRRSAVEQVGQLSECFFMYGEDLEWCLRMRKGGWEIWFCAGAEVVHAGSASSVKQASPAELAEARMNGIYRGLACHRGPVRMAAIHASVAMAAGLDCLSAKARGRSAGPARALLAYHVRSLVQGVR